MNSEVSEEREEFSIVLLVSEWKVGVLAFAGRMGQLTAFGDQHSSSCRQLHMNKTLASRDEHTASHS